MTASYSDLQVVPDSTLELARTNHIPGDEEKVTFPNNLEPVSAFDLHGKGEAGREDLQYPQSRRRICRLPFRTFWIVVAIIAIVIIAAAVGGGVGASLSKKHKSPMNTGSPPQSAVTTSSTSSSPSTGPITSSASSKNAITTTQVVGPSTTLLRDCPSSNNTIYDVSVGAIPLSFRKICNLAYLNSFDINAVVNIRTMSLNDCINLCAAYNIHNKTQITAGTSYVCNAVCWRNTFVNDDFPGQCFGYTTQNASNNFIINKGSEDIICDSAAWINESI